MNICQKKLENTLNVKSVFLQKKVFTIPLKYNTFFCRDLLVVDISKLSQKISLDNLHEICTTANNGFTGVVKTKCFAKMFRSSN